MEPFVSIIIPVFNRFEMTRRCLQAIDDHTPSGTFEVIVVDNGSTDDTIDFFKNWSGPFRLRYIRNEINHGYAKANNQGARIAEGTYLVLLNNDTEPQEDWLPTLLAVYKERKNVGAVGAKLLYPDGTIQHAGVITIADEVNSHSILPYHINYQRPDGPDYRGVLSVPAVTGACMMISNELYHQMGGLDEAYWNGYEDVDLCFKLLEAGYGIYVQCTSVVIHHESQSGPQRWIKDKENQQRLENRWTKRITCQYIMKQTDCFMVNDGITLILVVSNSDESVEGCLKQLEKTIRSHDEVVIVDTAAKNDTLTAISKFTSGNGKYQLISNRDHKSYAKVINQAVGAGENPYIFFLDPECRVNPEWLKFLFSRLESHKTAAAGSLFNRKNMIPTKDCESVNHRCNLAPSGVMVKRKPFELVGGLAESAHCGFEFEDLSRRLEKSGFQVAFIGDSEETTLQNGGIPPVSQQAMAYQSLTSIIILTYNQIDYTRQCIDSIFEHTTSPFELILVDNASTDGTTSFISSLTTSNPACTRIKVIANSMNVGFANGCNQGLREGQGDYYLLLNNDVVVTPGWLTKMISGINSNSRVGLVGPMTNYVSGPQLVKAPQYDVQTLKGLNQYATAFAEQNGGKFTARRRIVGFCLLIKRSVIEKIGGLDGRYGLGNFEDDDFCLRAYLAGYRALIIGDCYVHHFGGRTFLGNRIDYKQRMEQNWSLFKRKWAIPIDTALTDKYIVELSSVAFDPEKHFVPIHSAEQGGQKQHDFQNQPSCADQSIPGNNLQPLSNERTSQQREDKSLSGGNQMTILDQVFKVASDHVPSDLKGAAAWILGRMIDEDSRHGGAHHELGMIYFELGRMDEALHHLTEAVELKSDCAQFVKDLADFYHVAKHDSGRAVEFYERIVELQPDDCESTLTLAHLYMAQQNIRQALHFYHRVLEMDPQNDEVRQIIGRLSAAELSGINKQSVESLYQKAIDKAQAGDRQGALKELENILTINPEFALANNDLGVLHYEMGEKDTALKYYEKALKLDPENPVCLKNIAEYYWIEKQDAQAAMEKYIQVLKSEPGDIETLLGCGQICMSLGKDGDARDFFNNVLEYEPWNEAARQLIEQLDALTGSANAMMNRDQLYQTARVKVDAGDIGGAIDTLNELVTYFPEDASAYNDLGALNYENGHKEKTVQCYEKAVHLEPDNVTFAKNLADFYFMEEGRAEDAMRLYVAALEKSPNDVECLLAVGFVCNSLKKIDDAVSFFKQVLEIEPWNQTALHALSHIEQSSSLSPQNDLKACSSM